MDKEIKGLLDSLGKDLHVVKDLLDEAKREYDKGYELLVNDDDELGVRHLILAMCLASKISKLLGTMTPEMADKMGMPEEIRRNIM